MSAKLETIIDATYRTGSLFGIVKPGERYQVERVSPVELRLMLLEPGHDVPEAKLVLRDGRWRLPPEMFQRMDRTTIRDAIRSDRDEDQ